MSCSINVGTCNNRVCNTTGNRNSYSNGLAGMFSSRYYAQRADIYLPGNERSIFLYLFVACTYRTYGGDGISSERYFEGDFHHNSNVFVDSLADSFRIINDKTDFRYKLRLGRLGRLSPDFALLLSQAMPGRPRQIIRR